MPMSKRKNKPTAPAYQVPSWLTPDDDGKYQVNASLTRLDLAFPGSVRHLMPDPATIPQSLKYDSLVSTWFFRGLPAGTNFVPRAGIDTTKALAHVKCIMGSFEPRHEHKEAACAFLLEQWFESIEVPGRT